jgi:two-component system OmpR family response regulator
MVRNGCVKVANGREQVRILVIEDEPRILDFVSRGLEAEGFAVLGARDGQEGLRAAEAVQCDLVILDLLLPRLDGLSVLRALEAKHPKLPVVIVSARADLTTKLNGFGLGARDYLTKPFSFDELLARLRALTRRAPAERPVTIEVGELRLDPAAHRAWRGKAELDLSAKEFALLELLMRRPGRVLTRGQILEGAWDMSYERRSNVVDVYIRYLREKIDRPFGGNSIETVRGVGYRLREHA